MAVGATSGLAVGLLLLSTDDGDLDYKSGLSVGVITDKKEYVRGETVHVSIVNTGTVTLPGGPWDLEVTGLSGMRMYHTTHEGISDVLVTGDSVSVVWNQTKTDGQTILDGLYRISVQGPSEAHIRDSTIITIQK